MGLFDSIVDGIRGMADETHGDDGDGAGGGILDDVGRFLRGLDDADRSYEDDGYSDAEDEAADEGDGLGGGGWDLLGRVVDRFSGDGRRDPLVDGLVDRVRPHLPSEVRNVADSLLHGEDSSWAGRLVDPGYAHAPADWRPTSSAAFGHSFGEGRFDALPHGLMHSDAGGRTGAQAPAARPPSLAEDLNGDGVIDMYERSQSFYDGNGDGIPDMYQVGDDVPDVPVERQPTFQDLDANGVPDAYERRPINDQDGDGIPDEYDSFVTSGAAAAGPPAPAYHVPDDPTFPVDGTLAPVAAVTQADADFQQSIDDADQVDQSMDEIGEGLA